jgi:type III secretion protein U
VADAGGEKTEQPTAKKLLDARKKGQVPKSTDLSGSLALLAGFMALLALLPWAGQRTAQLFLAIERSIPRADTAVMKALVFEALQLAGLISLGPLAATAIVFTLSMWLQTGAVVSLDPVKPKLEHLDPVKGLKKMFAMKNLVQLLQMLIKTVVIAVAVYLVCTRLMPDAIRVILADTPAALAVAHSGVMRLLLWCGGLFVVLGVADFAFQRWQFTRENRMSVYEVKREHRESEGDAHLKAERKRAAQEPLLEDALKYLPMASLMVRHTDGRLVVLIHRPDLHERPLYLLRARAQSAELVTARAAERELPVHVDEVLLEQLYPGAQLGVPIQPEYSDQVLQVLVDIKKREAAA